MNIATVPFPKPGQTGRRPDGEGSQQVEHSTGTRVVVREPGAGVTTTTCTGGWCTS